MRYVKIENEGSLDLKFILNIIPETEPAAGEPNLADVIDVYMLDGEVTVTRDALASATPVGTLASLIADPDGAAYGVLYDKDEAEADSEGKKHYVETYTLVLKMQETAGNEYQDKTVGGTFSVQLLATQLASESDDLGNDYDANATYPVVSNRAPIDGNATEDETFTTKRIKVTAPADLVNALDGVVDTMELAHSEPRIEDDAIIFDSVEFYDEKGNVIDLEALGNDVELDVRISVGDKYVAGDIVRVYHNGAKVAEVKVDSEGYVNYTTTHFCEVAVSEAPAAVLVRDGVEYSFDSIAEAFEAAADGDVITLRASTNTNDTPLTETIVIDKSITLNPNGMYLASSAPATFTVVEGGKLVVAEGSFTIKNTASNGACVLVDGGEFVMEGGSFDGHTAMRTTEGKSSTVTLAAGWSNRVTVAFDSKGNDTINVTGGTIYSSAEAIKTTAGTHVNINISGGLLSSRTSQYSAAVNLQCTATVNMTGGKIENTYSSGYNGSPAIEVNVAPTTINLSGTAQLSSNGTCVMLGSHWSEPAVHEERIVLNMSGDAKISATSQMGFGIRYAQDNCDVNISGNAMVNATYQAIQFNTNAYVYTNSTLTVSENATITSTAGRIGGGYAIASNGHVTITGGTISGSTAGIVSTQAGAVVIIDNSESGTPITINKVNIGDGVTYTVVGDPSIG